jgi:methionine-S-sulfoxide reductase
MHVLVFTTALLLAMSARASESATAVFGGGCFWCLEAVYESVAGVLEVTSGYAGGQTANPTYKEVCSGRTGHAEVVRITFDPSRVTYRELLDLFWKAHDPTTPNRQGADVGTQYRSIIIAADKEQMAAAETSKTEAQSAFRDPIVTEITGPAAFHPAEDDHQDFFRNNPSHPYNRAVIRPKLEKLSRP